MDSSSPPPPNRSYNQKDQVETLPAKLAHGIHANSARERNSLKYTADEARSLKAYGELPETAKINETDTFGGEQDGDCAFEFDEDRDSDSGDEAGAGGKEVDIDDI